MRTPIVNKISLFVARVVQKVGNAIHQDKSWSKRLGHFVFQVRKM